MCLCHTLYIHISSFNYPLCVFFREQMYFLILFNILFYVNNSFLYKFTTFVKHPRKILPPLLHTFLHCHLGLRPYTFVQFHPWIQLLVSVQLKKTPLKTLLMQLTLRTKQNKFLKWNVKSQNPWYLQAEMMLSVCYRQGEAFPQSSPPRNYNIVTL